MRFLPAGFPFRQYAAEHTEQITAGGQLSLAKKNELLCRICAPVSTWERYERS